MIRLLADENIRVYFDRAKARQRALRNIVNAKVKAKKKKRGEL